MTEMMLSQAIDRIRRLADREDCDPRMLFDEAQSVISELSRGGQPIPPDLREILATAEAEMVDQFFDNLPL